LEDNRPGSLAVASHRFAEDHAGEKQRQRQQHHAADGTDEGRQAVNVSNGKKKVKAG